MSDYGSPRVFVAGEEQAPRGEPLVVEAGLADVLIVCGQGVYEDGTYYGEFHDRDVYLDHALRFPEIAERFHYNLVVTSGGFTQPRAPWLSEAESFLRMLEDCQAPWPKVPIILDEAALDSAENLILGLMTARLVLGSIPIRRVGIWAAWRFKKWRFNRNAEALGIVERTYFHGFVPAAATNIQVPPDDARQRTLAEYQEDAVEFGLLRRPDKEAKRQKRWQNNRYDAARDEALTGVSCDKQQHWSRSVRGDTTPIVLCNGKVYSKYSNRLAMSGCFTRTWEAIGEIAVGKSPQDAGLSRAFADEVMM